MYSVWCNGEHELYDMTVSMFQCRLHLNNSVNNMYQIDSYQMNNLYGQESEECGPWSVARLTNRLNGLTLSLKSCKGRQCTHPWEALHPEGNVESLKDAMGSQYDDFYEHEQYQVSFDHCTAGYIEEYEQPLRPLPFGGDHEEGNA